MKQLTIRGFDEDLARHLRRLSSEQKISLNRAALDLMRKGAGLSEEHQPTDSVGSELDSFIGVWSQEDEEEFLRSLAPFEQIDPELWT